VPQNWPNGHVAVTLTKQEEAECIAVTIHGVRHYLHSTTARELATCLWHGSKSGTRSHGQRALQVSDLAGGTRRAEMRRTNQVGGGRYAIFAGARSLGVLTEDAKSQFKARNWPWVP
jgi:hypothetical protein